MLAGRAADLALQHVRRLVLLLGLHQGVLLEGRNDLQTSWTVFMTVMTIIISVILVMPLPVYLRLLEHCLLVLAVEPLHQPLLVPLEVVEEDAHGGRGDLVLHHRAHLKSAGIILSRSYS